MALLISLAIGADLAACSRPASECPCAGRILRLATTTSVDNTGLLNELLPPFERRTGIQVQVLAVGTGQALKLAENGDVDAVVVHDRLAEDAFFQAGYGINHRLVMHNNFVLVGPQADPAGIANAPDALAAIASIATHQAPFVSRGDQSGTHKAELRLWKAAGLSPGVPTDPNAAGEQIPWYFEAGQGMRLTLNMADGKHAYCLTDRATFQSAKRQIELRVLLQGDARLHNPYSFIAVHPGRHPKAHYVEAMAFCGWLTSAEGQGMIQAFQVDGRALFIPDALTGK